MTSNLSKAHQSNRPALGMMLLIVAILLINIQCTTRNNSQGVSEENTKPFDVQLSNRHGIQAFIFEENGKQGLKDTLGNVILPATYDYIENWLQYGVARIDSGGIDQSIGDVVHYEMNKIGLVDARGNVLFEPQFDKLIFNGNPIAVVKKNGKYGYINNKGEYVVDLIFDDATAFQNGFAVIKTENGYGLINSEYDYVINPQFEMLSLHYTQYSKDTMLLAFDNWDSTKFINIHEEIFD